MKLLFDENISDRIVPQVLDLFPESVHVKSAGLLHSDDTLLWQFAKENGFTIVSKDSDFHQRSLIFGQPPKFIFLRAGNCSTRKILDLLRANVILILEFESDSGASILVLP